MLVIIILIITKGGFWASFGSPGKSETPLGFKEASPNFFLFSPTFYVDGGRNARFLVMIGLAFGFFVDKRIDFAKIAPALIKNMAKGKSQYCGWICTESGATNYVTYYNKRRNDEIVKELKKFCPILRKHTIHKRKDLKKSS